MSDTNPAGAFSGSVGPGESTDESTDEVVEAPVRVKPSLADQNAAYEAANYSKAEDDEDDEVEGD